MNRFGRVGLLAALAAVSVLGGCCEKEKQQLSLLQQDYNQQAERLSETQSDLAACRSRESELLAQLSSKEAELSSLTNEIATLRAGSIDGAGTEDGTTETATGWTPTAAGDKIVVGSDILFPSGKATLQPSGKAKLNKIVADLKSTYAGLPVRVYGFTDSDPIHKTKNLWEDNLDLSANRAMAVTRYLREKGIEAQQIETVAMGATNFVSSNASPAGKAKNRRVEIVVVK